MERAQRETKIFHSLVEFEKEFFPDSYKKKLSERKSKKPATFGTGFMMELLKGIRQQLVK